MRWNNYKNNACKFEKGNSNFYLTFTKVCKLCIVSCKENISSFLDNHLHPIAEKVNTLIKETNHFLRKIKSLCHLREEAILCTTDVVGLYPNILHV